MKLKLHHPWWTHLPAFIELLVLIVILALIAGVQQPIRIERNPLQPEMLIGWQVYVFRYLVVALLILISSVAWDALLARGELSKRFNLFAMLDELYIGMALLHVTASYLSQSTLSEVIGGVLMVSVLLIIVAACISAIVMEVRRPWQPVMISIPQDDTSEIVNTVRDRLRSDQHWTYWESQQYKQSDILLIALSQLVFAGAVFSQAIWGILLYVSIGFALVGFIGVLISSNPRVLVTAQAVTVSRLKIPISDIASVNVADASVLARGGVTHANTLSRTGGVLLVTLRGNKLQIGSNHPERLAAVIRTVKEYAEGMREGRS